jgi:sRNA-binding regulator protein Hfq
MPNAEKLLELAKAKFGELSPVDDKFFRAAAVGEFADYSSEDESQNDPATANSWGSERVLNANRIVWVCTDKEAVKYATHKGIMVEGARIDSDLDLEESIIPFRLLFGNCRISSDINLRRAELRSLFLINTHTKSIDVTCIKARGDIYFQNGFKASGEVCLPGAEIWGALSCEKSQFANKGKCALNADGIKVGGVIFLRNGFKAIGAVRLIGAVIGGDLDCENGQFENENGDALNADGIKVGGGIHLRNGFKAIGEVSLRGAEIGGDLDCENGQFENENGDALSMPNIFIKGNVYMRESFTAIGRVDMMTAHIQGLFQWRNFSLLEKVILDLRSAKICTLWDEERSWPQKGNLYIDELEYERIADESPKDSESRTKWLGLQHQYCPQPYEQLASVLEKSGFESDAKKIRIAKNWEMFKRGKISYWEKLWLLFLGITIGFGYRRWVTLAWMFLFILMGWGIFCNSADIFSPTNSLYANGNFDPFGYSLDEFIPLVNIGVGDLWILSKYSVGSFIYYYHWVHVFAGWILTTLLVASLTGLMKK